MDSADRQFSKPTDGHLCTRHRAVAVRSRCQAKATAIRQTKIADAPVNDRAAAGGAVHPAIAHRLEAAFSPARIAEIGRLNRKADHLRAQIALAEQ